MPSWSASAESFLAGMMRPLWPARPEAECRKCGAPRRIENLAATKVGTTLPYFTWHWRQLELSGPTVCSVQDKLALHQHLSFHQNVTPLHKPNKNTTVMVGHLNNVRQGQQAKLQDGLDYDVLIVGAGQVSCIQANLQVSNLRKLRVECTPYFECANLV